MRNRFLVVVIGLLMLLVGELHFFLKPQPTEQDIQNLSGMFTASKQWQGRYAPEFTLTTTQGEHFTLSDMVGKKVIVLNFFATWCEPCRGEMPEFQRYFEKHRDDPFLLLAIDAQETSDKVTDFFRELKLSFPVGIDDGRVQKMYGVMAYPTTVLIGVDGKVQYYEGGALPNADAAFDLLLRQNLQMSASGKAISIADYLKRVGVAPSSSLSTGVVLDGRAKRLAGRMGCPCGCDLRVASCNCQTATNIKKSLATGNVTNKSDAEIVRALNKKFCVGKEQPHPCQATQKSLQSPNWKLEVRK